MEKWKQIKGYEGLYEISNHGRVRSMDRVVTYSNGNKVNYKGKIRKASCSEYRLIALSKKGKVKMFKISRLVANHFIPKKVGKNIVNHMDGNKYNDHFLNLEWCTYSENTLHAFDTGLNKSKNKVPGVFFQTSRKKWASYLYRDGKNIFIGRFKTKEEAVKKRQKYLDENY